MNNPRGLTTTQRNTLGIVYYHGWPISVQQLAEAIDRTPHSARRRLQRLERAGWVAWYGGDMYGIPTGEEPRVLRALL